LSPKVQAAVPEALRLILAELELPLVGRAQITSQC
jgi:hypothetical protein